MSKGPWHSPEGLTRNQMVWKATLEHVGYTRTRNITMDDGRVVLAFKKGDERRYVYPHHGSTDIHPDDFEK